jgi:hypothetical protein
LVDKNRIKEELVKTKEKLDSVLREVEARKEYLSTVQQKNDSLHDRVKELESLLQEETHKRCIASRLES